MMSFRVSWTLLALALALPACKKDPEPREKSSKKPPAAVQGAKQRQALNALSVALREIAASAPEHAVSPADPATRAGAVLAGLRSIPAADLPESLRGPWQEMTKVLEEASRSTGAVSDGLRQRGEAAAAGLNGALAAEGLTDFRF